MYSWCLFITATTTSHLARSMQHVKRRWWQCSPDMIVYTAPQCSQIAKHAHAPAARLQVAHWWGVGLFLHYSPLPQVVEKKR